VSKTSDILIVGGGIIGGSIAFHLLQKDPNLRVTILEKEAETGTGSTSKATGGVRFQFSTEANVRLTQLSYRYFTHAEEILGRSVDFIRHGYLFVTTDAATLEQSKKSVALQQSLADLNTAYRNFFASVTGKRKGPKVELPRFKSRKDRRQAVRFTANARFRITPGGKLRLPKIGDIEVRWSRDLPSAPSSVTVIRDAAGGRRS